MPALEVKANVHTCLLMSVPMSVPELCVCSTALLLMLGILLGVYSIAVYSVMLFYILLSEF